MQRGSQTTGVERFFGDDEIIVSKTSLKGIISYANQTFLKVSGFSEDEVLGKPHSIIRHPDMPRCVFRLLWETIQSGQEIFAYVVNRCKNGDHYWVFAHVTPSFDADHRVVGYHSNRRVPERPVLEGAVLPLYRRLLDAERAAADPRVGLQASYDLLQGVLAEKGVGYDQFVFAL